jgi:predicted lysophospholipase L1 biosynthesis ABC-type transport system permease subunit
LKELDESIPKAALILRVFRGALLEFIKQQLPHASPAFALLRVPRAIKEDVMSSDGIEFQKIVEE